MEPKPWFMISWNCTNVCNLACKHCYIDAVRKPHPELLSTEEGMKLIDQVADFARKYSFVLFVFSGGEPLLRQDVVELIRYASEHRGIIPVMGSNGLLLEKLAGKLAEAGLRSVGVSLDSTKPERHDWFRGVPGAWERAVKGIKAALDAGIKVQIHFTITTWNYQEIPSIVELAYKLGASAIRIFGVVETGRASYCHLLDGVPYRQILDMLVDVAARSPIPVRPTCMPMYQRALLERAEVLSPSELQKLSVPGCTAARGYARVDYKGDVTPCPYMDLVLGNIRQEPLEKLIEEHPIMRRLRDRRNLRGSCAACPYREVCGGCRAQAYAMKGDVFDEDPLCRAVYGRG